MTSPKSAPMSVAHKEALAAGRKQGKAVRAYLEALESTKPKRGRKRTADSIQKRLEKIQIEFDEADALKRLELTQEKLDLLQELEQMDNRIDLSRVNASFTNLTQIDVEAGDGNDTVIGPAMFSMTALGHDGNDTRAKYGCC